ncbi:hypothetical protein BM221_009142 [Beauveria bassiana]|uniref:Uncharacterized protein n=1 Tax=Beauveria bassiana TaxID=176275 RepID=A0A2N6NCE6_BEABA|nr:hypothetical protein BM221_009142 [Beauveria bassiana]
MAMSGMPKDSSGLDLGVVYEFRCTIEIITESFARHRHTISEAPGRNVNRLRQFMQLNKGKCRRPRQ